MLEHNLPDGWIHAKISDISIKGLQRKPATDESFTYVDIGSIDRSLKKVSDPQVISGENAPSRARKVIESGDVLVSLTRPNLNAVALIDQKYHQQIASTGFEVIKPVLVDSRYIFALVRSKEFVDQISGVVQGALYPAAKSSDVQNFEFPLPPLAEQKVIADKLDTLLAQVENTKARLERIPKILKRFRQSVLAAAVSGRLTEEWRHKFRPPQVNLQEITENLFKEGLTAGNFGRKSDRAPQLTAEELELVVKHVEDWPLIRVGELCACIVPNRDKPKSFSGGYHWLLTPHFQEQSIHINYQDVELGLNEEEVIRYKARVISKSDVVMTCIGRLGLSAIVEEPSVINQQLHAFKANDYILPEYLSYCIRANKRFYEARSTSTTINYLNKSACNSLPIPVPTIEEQTEIVRRVDQLFAHADRIEQQVNNALTRVNNLTQSILAKAFRGELTEQWRKDNPELISGENSAEALLERIRSERAAMKPAKGSRRKANA